jgi:ATP-dependent DNA helicase RecG
MSKTLDRTLSKLADLVRAGRFEELETDTLEIKPVPSDSAAWTEVHKSACAFLNTRGGIIILGIKEEGTGQNRRYVFTGWQSHAEPKLAELPRQYTERNGVRLDLSDAFQPPMIRDFLDGKVGILLVDELAAARSRRGRRSLASRHRPGQVRVPSPADHIHPDRRSAQTRHGDPAGL